MRSPSPRPDLVGRSLVVDVPATTANLGSGFDALAMALDLASTIHVEVVAPGHPRDVTVEVRGEGAGELPVGSRNRFVMGLLAGLSEAGIGSDELGFRVRMENRIPVARGLGSSASATVAALVAVDALLEGALGKARILELAARAEGHADNAAAAVHGGLCVVSQVEGLPRAVRLDPPAGLLAALFIPDRHLSTAAMRAALPATVPLRDAVHNVGAVALLVASLAQGRLDLLSAGVSDRLHEPYRATVYPELPELVGAARAAGALGACLSGAGSTVIAFASDAATAATVGAAMERRAGELGLPGRAAVHAPRATGASVVAVDEVGPTWSGGHLP